MSARTSRMPPPREPFNLDGLTQIWRAVLGSDRIDPDRSFLELGGDSLLAAQAAAAIAERFGMRLTIEALWTARTLRNVAALLEADPGRSEERHTAEAPVRAVEPVGRVGTLATLVALRTPVVLDPQVLAARIRILLETHGLVEKEDGWLDLRTRDLSAVQPHLQSVRLSQLVRDLSELPLGGKDAPAVRVLCAHPCEGEHWIVVRAHPGFLDEWSVGLLADELSRSAGGGTPLAASDRSIARMVAVGGEVVRKQPHEGHDWRSLLPLTEGDVQPRRGACVAATLPRRFSQALRGLAFRENASVFMVLLACLCALLATEDGRNDVEVGGFTSNRSTVERARSIGAMSSYLPLRVTVDAGASFSELLGQVRQVVLAANQTMLQWELPSAQPKETRRTEGSASCQQVQPRALLRYFPGYRPRLIRDGLFDLGVTQYEMTWNVYVYGERVALVLEYDSARILERNAHELVSRLLGWVERAALAPETAITQLSETIAAKPPRALPSGVARLPRLHFFEGRSECETSGPRVRRVDDGLASIIISAHVPRSRRIERLLRIVREQAYAGGIEVILCDDGSPASEALTAVCRAFEVSYVRVPRPAGEADQMQKCRALNAGIRAAKGKYLFFLDQDMLPLPHHLQNCVNLIRAHGPTTVCHGRRLPLVELLAWGQLSPYSRFHLHLDEVISLLKRVSSWEPVSTASMDSDWSEVWGNNLVLTRELVDRTGWFDEGYVGYGMEDHDYVYRLHLEGARYAVLENLPVFHIGHPRQEQRDSGPLLRNQARFCRKFPEVASVWPELFARCIG